MEYLVYLQLPLLNTLQRLAQTATIVSGDVMVRVNIDSQSLASVTQEPYICAPEDPLQSVYPL